MGGKVLVLDVVLVINVFKYLLFPSDSILQCLRPLCMLPSWPPLPFPFRYFSPACENCYYDEH